MTTRAQLSLSDLPPGAIKQVTVGEDTVAVANVNGEIFAVHDTCTHARVPLSGGCLEGRQIICPWHGAMFDLKTGRATCGPAYSDLRTYKVTVIGDTITIEP